MESSLKEAMMAREERRFDEAVRILTGLFEQIDRGVLPLASNHFGVMFEWSLLVQAYPAAHQALTHIRDEQLQSLRDGRERFGHPDEQWPPSRFSVIVAINDILNDRKSTYELFVELVTLLPTIARREAYLALPAIVEMGDFTLADTYLPDPLKQLTELNNLANELPVYPPLREAPRLAAELSNFMKDVILRAAILEGLGRNEEAQSLRHEAVAGLGTDEMRKLGIAEIAVPGSIIRELTSRQMKLEKSAGERTVRRHSHENKGGH
jgi:hypothetical protein